MALASDAAFDRRTPEESEQFWKLQSNQPINYLRKENNKELKDGIELPDDYEIFTWDMARSLWPMGVCAMSQAMCSVPASKMVSFLFLMLEAAHKAGARVIIETLVNNELWEATANVRAATDRRTAQHTAVEGYRIFIICSRLQLASLCNALMSHMQRELSVHAGVPSKPRRKERTLEDLAPGDFCVHPGRIRDISDARRAILMINGNVKDHSLDLKSPVTLEFDAALSTSTAEDANNLVFNAAALDDAEPDIGDVVEPPAPADPADGQLPKDHLLYPLKIELNMDSDISKMRNEQNNLPEEQTCKSFYLIERDDGRMLFRPPIPVLALMLSDEPSRLRRCALPEFKPDLEREERWLAQQLAAIGVYVSLRDMSDAEKEKVLSDRIVNPADCTPIQVEPSDYDFGTEDPRMEKHYPELTCAARKTLMVRNLYRNTGDMDSFIKLYVPKVLGLLFNAKTPGVPPYLHKIEEQQRALIPRIGPHHEAKPSRLAHTLLTSYPEMLRSTRGLSFWSFFVREQVDLLGQWMGMTHTQMVVLMLLLPLMSRVGMINFRWPAPFAIITSEPGVGKSEMMRAFMAMVHMGRLWSNGGPSTGQGAALADIEGQVACYDEGMSAESLRGNALNALKQALESRETSMTRQVPVGNGIYKQMTTTYKHQGGAIWLSNVKWDGALGDRAVQISAGVLSGSDQERQSTSERVAGPSRPNEYKAATILFRLIDGHGNRIDRMWLAGALHFDTTMHHVLISIAYTLLGKKFSEKLKVREVAQLEPLAVGHARFRLAAQWLALTQRQLPSTVESEDLEQVEREFYMHNATLTGEDVSRAFWLMTEINMTEQVRMDVIAALRPLIVFENDAPRVSMHDRRYYETQLASNDASAVVGLCGGRHGPPTILQTLKDLRRVQHDNAPVVTVVKGNIHVLAASVHRPQVQTQTSKKILNALREVFNSTAFRSEWALTFDGEDRVVFSVNVLRLFCEVPGRSGHDTALSVAALGTTNRDTLQRELTMMALAGLVTFKSSYTAVGQFVSAAVGILHDAQNAPSDAHALIEDGGYAQLLEDEADEMRKVKRLWQTVLIVPLESILNNDVATGSTETADSIRDVIIQTMAVEGRTRAGDTLNLGLHAAGGGSMVSITFTDAMLESAKKGMRLRHLNCDRRRANAIDFIHGRDWQKKQTNVDDAFLDVLFPRMHSHVRLPPIQRANVMPVGRAVAENHSLHLCGAQAPPHFRHYMSYPSIPITVTRGSTTVNFYVSARTPDVIADALYYADITEPSDNWYMLGYSDGVEVHFSRAKLFARKYDTNTFELVRTSDPFATNTPTAKRVLSATESGTESAAAKRPRVASCAAKTD